MEETYQLVCVGKEKDTPQSLFVVFSSSKGPSAVGVSLPSLEDGSRSSFQNVFYYLEFWMMNKSPPSSFKGTTIQEDKVSIRFEVPPKRRFLQEPHGVTTQKTPFFKVSIVSLENEPKGGRKLGKPRLRWLKAQKMFARVESEMTGGSWQITEKYGHILQTRPMFL
jgi:hypothetical protein